MVLKMVRHQKGRKLKKLKWKKGNVDSCTPFKKIHRVKGYIHAGLGVHKIPSSKPTAWTITHMVTGMGVVHDIPVFRIMADVKEFASKLLEHDDWIIEGAEWGSYNNYNRVIELSAILRQVQLESGFEINTKKMRYADEKKERHLCDCGKIAQRYVLSMDRTKKWVHKCLECEPYDERIEK